jgi:hypothetical protein
VGWAERESRCLPWTGRRAAGAAGCRWWLQTIMRHKHRRPFGGLELTSLVCGISAAQYSANCGVTYVYGPPGYEPQQWGLPGNPYQPGMVSLPADYVEVFQ